NTLLFMLSLIPFTTGWMGENNFATLPVAAYAVNLTLCALAFYFLQTNIVRGQAMQGPMFEALKKQERKGYISLIMYISAIPCAFYFPMFCAFVFGATAIMWII